MRFSCRKFNLSEKDWSLGELPAELENGLLKFLSQHFDALFNAKKDPDLEDTWCVVENVLDKDFEIGVHFAGDLQILTMKMSEVLKWYFDDEMRDIEDRKHMASLLRMFADKIEAVK